MFKRFLGLILATAVAVAAVASTGCGGGGDQALTKTEFVKQGNTICENTEKERQKALAAAAEQFNPQGNVPAQQAEIIDKAMVPYEDQVEEFADLEAPAAESKGLDELVAAMEEAAEKVEQTPQTAVESNIQFKNANKKAEELGLDKCIV